MKDLRVKKTYLFLKKALIELLSKKSFEEIRVNDICNLAMVHRTTFYSHFSDKYELLDYCIKDVEQEIWEKISHNTYSNNKDFYTKMVMSILEYIGENKVFFKNILKKNSDSGFINIFTNACISYIYEMLNKEEINGISHDVPIEVISQFYAGAVISTIIWWLKSDNSLSETQLCNYIISLIFDIPHK